jgi:hypothetical protein
MYKKNKVPKYRNTKVEFDRVKFDSKREKDRYVFLKQKEKEGVISDLKLQPKYELIPAIKEKYIKQLKTKTKECERTLQFAITYRGDFSYYKNGVLVVEDVKASPQTAALDKAFLLKEKLFRWKYGFSIKRVYKETDEI